MPRSKPQIMAADSKGRLEDIYLPYKPKRRTKAEIAKEAGLEPLADLLLTQPAETIRRRLRLPSSMPTRGRRRCRRRARGARAILVERFAEDADLIGAPARAGVVERHHGLDRPHRQEDRRREVQGLFRFLRAAARSCRRTASWRCSVARRKRSSTCTIKPEAEAPAVGVPSLLRVAGS